MRIVKDLDKIAQSLENMESLKPPIKWTSSVVDFVELAYEIIESMRFNGGDVDINAVVQYLCDIFSFEVKD